MKVHSVFLILKSFVWISRKKFSPIASITSPGEIEFATYLECFNIFKVCA